MSVDTTLPTAMREGTPRPRIGVNILHYLGGQAAMAAFGIVTTALLARYMSKAEFGEFTFLVALATLLLPIVDLGANGLYSRSASRDRGSIGAFWARALGIRLYGIPIAAALLVAYAALRGGGEGIPLLLVLLYLTAQSVLLSTDVVFRAGEYARSWATRRIVYEVSYLLLTLISLVMFGWRAAEQQYVVAIAAVAAGTIWASITAFRLTRLDWSRLREGVAKRLDREEFRQLWPFAVNAALFVFYYRLTAVLLQEFGSSDDVADFRVVFVVMTAALYLPKAVSWAASPRIALLSEEGNEEAFNRVMRRSGDANLFIAGVVTIGGLLYGSQLIRILFGPKYEDLGLLVPVLVVATGVFFLQQFSTDLLNYLHHERYVVRTFTAGIAVLTVLNVVLIPMLGALGAAWARLAAGCLMAPFNLRFLASAVGGGNLHGMSLARFALVNAGAAAVGAGTLGIDYWLSLVSFLVSYVLLAYWLKCLPIRYRGFGRRER